MPLALPRLRISINKRVLSEQSHSSHGQVIKTVNKMHGNIRWQVHVDIVGLKIPSPSLEVQSCSVASMSRGASQAGASTRQSAVGVLRGTRKQTRSANPHADANNSLRGYHHHQTQQEPPLCTETTSIPFITYQQSSFQYRQVPVAGHTSIIQLSAGDWVEEQIHGKTMYGPYKLDRQTTTVDLGHLHDSECVKSDNTIEIIKDSQLW